MLDPALRDAGVAKLPEPSPVALSPAAFANRALIAPGRAPHAAPPPVPEPTKDACADALPTRIVVPPHKRGSFELPNQIEFSCTKDGALCLTKDEEDRIRAARQGLCQATLHLCLTRGLPIEGT